MISWIVASHNRDILYDNLLATLQPLPPDDQVVRVENAPSIAAAYNEGARRARWLIRCYVHHDVQILDLAALRAALLDACQLDTGIVGVVGSRTPRLPWWEGDTCGSVRDARMGLLNFGPGGVCSYLDGLLLATAQPVEWDESYPGWHLYDHDVCQQMLARGLPNRCLDGGHRLVFHNTAGPTDTDRLTAWRAGTDRFREKWWPTASTATLRPR